MSNESVRWADRWSRLEVALEEILVALQRANSVERSGAVSSVEIEDQVKGPKLTTKVYAGSEPPVAEAIDAHAQAYQLAHQNWLSDWKLTVEQLLAERQGRLQVPSDQDLEELPNFEEAQA